MLEQDAFRILQYILVTSIFYVWVVRYQNIVEEFRNYGLPSSIRDLVGILKLSSAVMIVTGDPALVQFGAFTIGTLMVAAVFTHIFVKSPIVKALPSASLLTISALLMFGG